MRDYFLIPKELAAYARKSEYTIRKWCREGRFKAFKFGSEWRIPITEIRKSFQCVPLEVWEEISEDRYRHLHDLESVRMRINRRRNGMKPSTGERFR